VYKRKQDKNNNTISRDQKRIGTNNCRRGKVRRPDVFLLIKEEEKQVRRSSIGLVFFFFVLFTYMIEIDEVDHKMKYSRKKETLVLSC